MRMGLLSIHEVHVKVSSAFAVKWLALVNMHGQLRAEKILYSKSNFME